MGFGMAMLASLTADELCCVLKQFDFTTATSSTCRPRHDHRSEAVRNLMSCGSTCKLLRQLADEMLATWLSVRMCIEKTPIELSEEIVPKSEIDREIDLKQLEDLFWAVGTVRLTSHKHTQFIAAGLMDQLIAMLREADALCCEPPVQFEDGRPRRFADTGGMMRPTLFESLHGNVFDALAALVAKGTAIPSSDVDSIIHAAFDTFGPKVLIRGRWVYPSDGYPIRLRFQCIAVLLRELSLTNAERRVYGDLEATVCAAIRAVYHRPENEEEGVNDEDEDDEEYQRRENEREERRRDLEARADAEEKRIRSLYDTMAAELNEVPHDEMAGLLTSSHIQQILRQLIWPLNSQSPKHFYRKRCDIVVSFLKTLAPAAKHAVRFIAEAHEEHPDPFLNMIGAEALATIDDDDEWQPGEAEMEAEDEDEAAEEELEAEGEAISGEDADDVGYGPRDRPGRYQDSDSEQQEARARVNAVQEWCMASEGRYDLIDILPSNILEHVQTEQEMEELSRVLIEWEAARSNHAEQISRRGVWYGLDGEPNEILNEVSLSLQGTSL